MKALEDDYPPEVCARARRVKRWILWIMAIFILLPFLLVWITDSVGF